MNDREKVIDRIQKLLALSRNNPSEAEAASAAEKVQAILAEHKLTMAEVETKSAKEDTATVEKWNVTSSVPWRRGLAAAVAGLYFCKYIYAHVYKHYDGRVAYKPLNRKYTRLDNHYFVGSKSDVMVAQTMFQYLNDTVERLANEGSLKYPVYERTKYRTSFKAACAIRLANRIWKRIEDAKAGKVKTEGGTNLPALLDLYAQAEMLNAAAVKEAFKGETTTAAAYKPKPGHIQGYREGYDAGGKIGIDQQIEDETGGHILISD